MRFAKALSLVIRLTTWAAIVVAAFIHAPGIASTQTQRNDDNAELRHAADLLRSGSVDEAEPLLRHVLISNPRNADAHNLLGVILDQRGKTADAEREFRAALRFSPDSVAAMANLGVLLAHAQRDAEAMRLFASVLRLAPNHPQATINLGLLYATRHDYEQAAHLLTRANELQPGTYEIQYRLGMVLYNLKRLDEASVALEAASVLSSNAAEPFYYLGLIAAARGQDETAGELWEKALARRPVFPEANLMLADLLRKNQRTKASVEFYRRAWEQDPTQYIYYARLGGVYLALAQIDQALEVFRRGALKFPSLPEAHYFAGIAARAQSDYDLAEIELRKSLALGPDNVNALAQLGVVLLERQRIAEAETVLRKAIAINDKHFYANYDLGRLLNRTQRYEAALPILTHAAMLKPNNPGVHYQLFMAFSRLKRKDEADRELAVFKQLDEARKSRPNAAIELDDDDVQNPSSALPGQRNP